MTEFEIKEDSQWLLGTRSCQIKNYDRREFCRLRKNICFVRKRRKRIYACIEKFIEKREMVVMEVVVDMFSCR
jgi:hypothetical protein